MTRNATDPALTPNTTWADGYGNFHAAVTVQDCKTCEQKQAWELLRTELEQRVKNLDPDYLIVTRVATDGRLAVYREGWPVADQDYPATMQARIEIADQVARTFADLDVKPSDAATALGLSTVELHKRLSAIEPFTVEEFLTLADHLGLTPSDLLPPSAFTV